jgi:hypothetical protein
MDTIIAKAVALLASAGLQCPGAEFETRPDILIGKEQTRIAGAYMGRAGKDGAHLIWLNARTLAWYDERRTLHLVLHELVHCGRYDLRDRFGQRHPPALDEREEQLTDALTRALLNED